MVCFCPFHLFTYGKVNKHPRAGAYGEIWACCLLAKGKLKLGLCKLLESSLVKQFYLDASVVHEDRPLGQLQVLPLGDLLESQTLPKGEGNRVHDLLYVHLL